MFDDDETAEDKIEDALGCIIAAALLVIAAIFVIVRAL